MVQQDLRSVVFTRGLHSSFSLSILSFLHGAVISHIQEVHSCCFMDVSEMRPRFLRLNTHPPLHGSEKSAFFDNDSSCYFFVCTDACLHDSCDWYCNCPYLGQHSPTSCSLFKNFLDSQTSNNFCNVLYVPLRTFLLG
jgi:hypothetical protein